MPKIVLRPRPDTELSEVEEIQCTIVLMTRGKTECMMPPKPKVQAELGKKSKEPTIREGHTVQVFNCMAIRLILRSAGND